MVQAERVKRINNLPALQNGKVVVYWMQQAQRAYYNHALEYAISRANELNLPLIVFFGLTSSYPGANYRHYLFMLQGLKETAEALSSRGIQLVIEQVSPEQGIVDFCKKVKAAALVCDKGYLRIQRKWRNFVYGRIECEMWEIESDAVVPVEIASSKEEFAARTLRPKIHKIWKQFLIPVKSQQLHCSSLGLYKAQNLDINNLPEILNKLSLDYGVGEGSLRGGRSEALKHLNAFLSHKLGSYSVARNEPSNNSLSLMSPYLHFGQISSLEIALKIMESNVSQLNIDTYLEELIVRRELSMNFCYYNQDYDIYDKALPAWALKTLEKHSDDSRPYVYSLHDLEQVQTHDQIWNAAQMEMILSGKMHGYMRMYWGKKILEWSKTPEEAFRNAIYLNDKYELDGRDPNGYTGVAWCFGKHDRPWGPERPIFGLVRYMNENGIKRKINWQAYLDKWLLKF